MKKRLILVGAIIAVVVGGIAFATAGNNHETVATAQFEDPIWADYQMSTYLNHEVVENDSPDATEALGRLLGETKFTAKYMETVGDYDFYIIKAENVTLGDKFFPECRWLVVKLEGMPTPINQDAFNLEAELERLRAG